MNKTVLKYVKKFVNDDCNFKLTYQRAIYRCRKTSRQKKCNEVKMDELN